MTYKSVYVWPNAQFPFRIYYNGENLRIFIIENLQHNFVWLSEYKDRVRNNDVFLVILGSHWNEYLLQNALDMFDYLNIPRKNFRILFNDSREQELFKGSGLQGSQINQNAWLDYNGPMQVVESANKKYDAIYVGRLIKVKRHYLANQIENLALVAGRLYGNNVEETAPPHIYRNDRQLIPEEVANLINESNCGLILSEKEGACFASSEYLLCGIPVVSTPSEGGRDAWYDDYNSIVCDPSIDAVTDAVQYFKNHPRDPYVIRNKHIELSNIYRARFVQLLSDLFEAYGEESIDAKIYFEDNFFHKMRRSYKPNFEEIFNEVGK